MNYKILILDGVHPCLTDFLADSGIQYDLITDIDYAGYLSLPDHYSGVILRSKVVLDQAAIDSKRNLKFIIRLGSGVENIAVDYAESCGITCFSTPAGNASSVGEYCLAALFSALKNIPTADREVKDGNWLRKKNRGKDLCNLTIGIIGYGHTGKAFARKINGLAGSVLTYDRYKPSAGDQFAKSVDLEMLMAESDVISLHINYLPENHYFFNQDIIAKSSKPFIFINSSRGQAVNTEDLLVGLQSGTLSFACLDVLEYETPQLQLPEYDQWPATLRRLVEMKNVILTPHIAGQTSDSERRHAELAIEILKEWNENG